MPNITEILDQLGRCKYFSTLDLASGFHQVPIDPENVPKTAFSTPFQHLQFKRMAMRLKEAPATFQALMDRILTVLKGIELFVYMDDIVLYAVSLKEHNEKMKKLFGRLKTVGLTLQPDKCLFVISENGVRPDPKKTQAVFHFLRPKTRKNIKQFLGLAGYYRRFIPNFAKTAKSLNNLLKKEISFVWETNQEVAFTELKSNKDLPIAYYSSTILDAETRYTTTKKELLAVVRAVTHFRPYLYGTKFTLVTDHRSLI